MAIYQLNPLADPRWTEFVARHPRSSIFHYRGWLQALQLTYGYEPTVYTNSPPEGELTDGLVFCQVKSWLTGKRLVSLPFSDHCQPLAEGEGLRSILEALHNDQTAKWKYIEIRPLLDEDIKAANSLFGSSAASTFHSIDLRPAPEIIYRRFHDSCVRRKIKRADKEQLTYEIGNSEQLLMKFRHLLVLTRRRHKLPPQPMEWFRNLVDCLGDRLRIRVLSKDQVPVASIITLQHGRTIVYKYGCSDANFHHVGGMPLLFWKTIQESKQMGAEVLDLGRSEPDDPGLIAFKGHLGAVASNLQYYRYPAPPIRTATLEPMTSWARQALASLPDPALIGAGRLLYRHLG